jgi:beta-glucosidase
MPTEPQFPFGHGLSYARMTLTNLSASAQTFRVGEGVAATVEVLNEGSIAGEATIFLFLRDVVATVARPVLELKDVAKILLGPGQSANVRFAVPASVFAFPGADFQPRTEPGRFELSVGFSADRTKLLTIDVEAVAG